MEFDYEIGKCFICNDDCGVSQGCKTCMRKLSLNEIYISAQPKSYSVENDIYCAYCQCPSSLIEGSFDFGIRYCFDHKIQAQTDMKKWLITNNCILIQDIKERHKDLYRILCNGIPVMRSSGLIDNDWKLDKSKILVMKDKKVGWVLTFVKFEVSNQSNSLFTNKITKNIPISFLIDNQIYHIYFNSMLKKMEKSFDIGFYNE
jgi:hypothetical protein